ncbi:MAG: glycosyl hydrolase [Caulobacteraceae bacterium]
MAKQDRMGALRAALATIFGAAAVLFGGVALAGALTPPTIPTGGAYLGAWVNPLGLISYDGANEIPQLALFNRQIGKPVAVLHVYTLFGDPFPSDTLAAVAANGSIPLVDWSCANVTDINTGREDATITAEAQGFKAFGKPAFLRWFWEMNLNTVAHSNCGAYNNGPTFRAAWQRLWRIFHQVGATNVALVWCPSAHGDATSYYPGNIYVDWLGADNYDRANEGVLSLHDSFAHFYAQWAPHGKPIMIGETAATTVDQYLYIPSIGQQLPSTFPQIKAVMYFDAPGNSANWSLQGAGITTFRALANTPYFSFR